MMKSLIVISLCLLISNSPKAQASVEVLFHPQGSTLPKIAQWISEAKTSVDIAMYNMETSQQSVIIQTLSEARIQSRIKSGDLSIRLIFEGYATPEENQKKMTDLEKLGLDARYLGRAVKIHHKFAVIDPGQQLSRVITGSANWSLSSYNNYDENILFLDSEPEATLEYLTEFERLWKVAKKFGNSIDETPRSLGDSKNSPDLEFYFNSPRHLKIPTELETNLESQVVKLIEDAQSEILIATTRMRLLGILSAIRDAADRGVQIYIVLSQDDWQGLASRRKTFLLNPNIHLRIKFYNLDPKEYMTYQMHNKWMLVDQSTILTGSFNWSLSSENNHIENLVVLRGDKALEVLPNFLEKFYELWEKGRKTISPLKNKLNFDHSNGRKTNCAFSPVSLEFNEIHELLTLAPNCRP